MGQSPSNLSAQLGNTQGDITNAISDGTSVDPVAGFPSQNVGNEQFRATEDPNTLQATSLGTEYNTCSSTGGVSPERPLRISDTNRANVRTQRSGSLSEGRFEYGIIHGDSTDNAKDTNDSSVPLRATTGLESGADNPGLGLGEANQVGAKVESERVKDGGVEVNAKLQEDRDWGMCASCKAEGYDKRKCTGCHMARYCNRECQRKDFERHKDICNRISRFESAKSKINPALKEMLLGPLQFHGISDYLGSIPDRERYALTGPRICVLVEIVEILGPLNPIVCPVKVRDVTNHWTTVLINLFAINFLGSLRNPLSILSISHLKPGNFILLINVYWNIVGSKTGTIVIERPEQIHIVTM